MDDNTKNPAPLNPQVALQDLEELTHDPVPTMAEEIADFEASHGGKEVEPAYAEASAGKPSEVETELEEVPENPEIEKDLEGYMEKVERAAEKQQVVVDDYTNQVLLGKTGKQDPIPELPLTEAQVRAGLHHKVMDGLRWLAEWCVRQIKLLHGRVRFKK